MCVCVAFAAQSAYLVCIQHFNEYTHCSCVCVCVCVSVCLFVWCVRMEVTPGYRAG